MAITVASNFDQTAAVPLDSRTVVADSTARDAIASGVRYEGLTVYVVADAKNYQLIGGIANGDWTELQGAGGGGINYILTPDGADITGWAAYADAAGTSPVDGTGGSPATTFAVSTDSSLVGTENFVWTKSAADRQGEGFSYAFSIDQAYQSKPMTISALYKVASGTYADNDMTVWVYDVTNSVLIQPSAYQIKNTTGVEQIKCEFQAASNSTSYRLIFHTASTSASAYTLRFDSFSVSPNTYNAGAVVTAPVAYTPTFSGFGTVTVSNFKSWRSGAHLFVEGTFTAGTPTAAEARITFGYNGVNGGLTADSTINSIQAVGNWFTNANGAATDAVTVEPSVGYFTFGHGYASASPLGKSFGNVVVGTGSVMSFYARVPIAGWGTSQVLSSETDTRIVAAILTNSSSLTMAAGTLIVNTASTDTHGAYNTSTGVYTVPVSGFYDCTGSSLTLTGAGTNAVGFQLNAGTARYIWTFGGTGTIGGGATQLYANAGDTIKIYGSGTGSAIVAGAIWTITRRSGPAQIAASEKVSAVYTLSANSAPGAGNQLNFNTKVTDSHGAVTTGASWKFTAPSPRTYLVSTSIAFSSTAGYLTLFKNGTAYRDVAYVGTGAGQSYLSTNTVPIDLISGDYIDFRASTTTTFAGGAAGAGVAQITAVSITSQG